MVLYSEFVKQIVVITMLDVNCDIKWLVSEACKSKYYIYTVCKNGLIEAMKQEKEEYDKLWAFRGVCMNGYLEMAYWLADRGNFTKEDVMSCGGHTFYVVCGRGYKEIATWIADRWNLTKEDVMSSCGSAFVWACDNGHTEIATWIADRWNFTKENVMVDCRYGCAYYMAREKGHKELIKWFGDKYGIYD